MKTEVFNNAWQFAKQRELAEYFLNRLCSQEIAEHPCNDYRSACSLSRILQSIDKERRIQSISIYSTFVRIKRNEKGGFAFSAVVLDHVAKNFNVSEC